MSLAARLKNSIRGAAQKWGSSDLKRTLWNKEFQEGRWDFIEDTRGDVIYPFLEKYCRGGKLLDLGCGTGNTGCELDLEAFSKCVGVDISTVALEKARLRSESLGRSGKNEYILADIALYQPLEKFRVILFRESIYYIPRAKTVRVLHRCAESLEADGVIIIRTHNQNQAQAIKSLFGSHFAIVEEKVFPTGVSLMIIRPIDNAGVRFTDRRSAQIIPED